MVQLPPVWFDISCGFVTCSLNCPEVHSVCSLFKDSFFSVGGNCLILSNTLSTSVEMRVEE